MAAKRAGGARRVVDRQAALLLIAAAALAPSALVGSDRVVCPVRLATGVPCPGCGLSRSWHALLHGRPGTSLRYHPLGPVAMALLLAFAAGLDERPGPIGDGLRRPGVLPAFGVAWMVVWLARLRAGWRGV